MLIVDVYLVALVATTILSLFLCVRAYSWPAPGAKALGFTLAGIGVYSMSYAFELSATGLSVALRAVKFEYLGLLPMMVSWLAFTARFSGLVRVTPVRLVLISAVPTLTLLVVWTDGLHHLFYSSAFLSLVDGVYILHAVRGPWYWVHVASFWLYFGASLVFLGRPALRGTGAIRGQARVSLVGGAIPALAELLHLLRLIPLGLDPIPLAFGLSGLVFATAILRGEFLEVALAARAPVLAAMSDGVLVVNRSLALADANPAAQRILGFGAEVVGRSFPDLVPDRPELVAVLAKGEGRVSFSTPDNERGERCYSARAFPVRGADGRSVGTAAIIEDVTETTALMERLSSLAATDDLTGLLNRRRFMELGISEFEVAKRASRPFSVAMLDLDHFKRVNDSHGHAAGDAVLKEAARRMSCALRIGDVLCRFGGEEFALIMPETAEEGAAAVAERLRSALSSSRVEWEGASIVVTTSIGLCGSVPAPGSQLDDFLACADEALYRAKAEGRNRVARDRGEHRSS